MKKALMVAVAVFTGLSICLAQDAAYVWVEGKDPATQNMHQHNWYIHMADFEVPQVKFRLSFRFDGGANNRDRLFSAYP